MAVAVLTRVAAFHLAPRQAWNQALWCQPLCARRVQGASALGNLMRGGFVTGSAALWNDGMMPVNL